MIDTVKNILSNIPALARSGNPTAMLETAVECSAILAGLNERIATLEHLYSVEVAKWLEGGDTAVAARIKAQARESYRDYKIAKGIGEALESTITSLRKQAEALIKEFTLTGQNNG